MFNKRCFTNVLQIILSLSAISSFLYCSSVHAQATTYNPLLETTTSEDMSVRSAPRSPAKVPPELCLLGIWSYEATTHGMPAEWGGDVVQRGHWAVTYSDGAYMTAYLFDKANVTGQRFLLNVYTQNDKMFVERIDVQDTYTKHFGICRVNKDGSTIELAFNNPLDGSAGAIPTSFDPKSEPKGFLSIKLKRLSDQPAALGHSQSQPIKNDWSGPPPVRVRPGETSPPLIDQNTPYIATTSPVGPIAESAIADAPITFSPSLTPPPQLSEPASVEPAILEPLPPFSFENIRIVRINDVQSKLHVYFSTTERISKSKDVVYPDGTRKTVPYEIFQPIGETQTASIPLGQVDIFDRSGKKVDVSTVKDQLANRTPVFIVVGAEVQYVPSEKIASLIAPESLVVRINVKPEEVQPLLSKLGLRHDSLR